MGRQLDERERRQVLDWIGMCFAAKDIPGMVFEKFGKKISVQQVNLYKYGDVHKAYIQKVREAWGREIFLIDLACKRKRLEKLEGICNRNEGKNDKIALDALGQIKSEVEKEFQNLSMTNYNINVYKHMTEEELEAERVKSLERIKALKGAIHAVDDQRT